MPMLTIAAPALGPLKVEVRSVDGSNPLREPIFLSSISSQEKVEIQAGNYLVVGRRPNGETLVETVSVGQSDALVTLVPEEAPSTDILQREKERGLVPPPLRTRRVLPVTAEHSGTRDRRLIGSAVAHLAQSALGYVAPLFSGASGPSRGVKIEFRYEGRQPNKAELVLRCWRFTKGEWEEEDAPAHDLQAEYLRIVFDDAACARAVALQDRSGFGPVVVAPPFKGGLAITFLGANMPAIQSFKKSVWPALPRVPIAVSLPAKGQLADLLSGIDANSLEGADQLWKQQGRELGVSTEHALDMLLHEFSDPVAAVLAAHYLGRYDPQEVPVDWLYGLVALLPDVADPFVLLAWRLFNESRADQQKFDRETVLDLLRKAEAQSCTYFARTRVLLAQGQRLFDRSSADNPSQSNKKMRNSNFLNVGAGAGGLDAFWGRGPTSPAGAHAA